MIEFNIKLPYVVRKQLRESGSYWKHDRQITENLVRDVLIRKYPQGSKESSIIEIHADIDEAFAAAVNDEKDTVFLERLALKHILDAATSVDIPVEFSAHVRRLRDHIKKTLDEDDAREKAKKNGAEASVAEVAKQG